MSRQTGSIVRGISKPRRISVKRAGSRWPLCTAGGGERSRSREKPGPAAEGSKYGHRARRQTSSSTALRTVCKINSFNDLERWQEWQGSNLRPPVLETGALPIELHSCGEPASADPGRLKHRRRPDCKAEAAKARFGAAASRDSSPRSYRPAVRPRPGPRRCQTRPGSRPPELPARYIPWSVHRHWRG